MASRRHPEQAFKTILGMIRLGDKFGQDRLEKACCRALESNAVSYRSVNNILKSGLDKNVKTTQPKEQLSPITHENIRGPEYFN